MAKKRAARPKLPGTRSKTTRKTSTAGSSRAKASKTTTKKDTFGSALSGAKRPEQKKFKPLWTLEKGVTFSGLQTWETCQEQFGLKYVDGWTQKKVSIPLEYGSLFHFGLEHQFKFSSPQECIAAVTSAYKKYRAKSVKNSKERDTLDALCGLATVTFPHYCKYWGDDDKSIEWIGREEKFSVPYVVQTPEGPREIRLNGMRDGLFREKRMKGLFETKTKSRWSDYEIINGLKADMQTLFYCFVTAIETGEAPQTVKYNIIRRYDINKRLESKKNTLDSVMNEIDDDMIRRPEFYFARFRCDLAKSDIENFRKRTLDPLLVRFIHWWDNIKKNPTADGRFESPYHSLNLNSLIGKYGTADTWDIIVNKNFHNFQRRTSVFPELEDSFLDMPATRSRKRS